MVTDERMNRLATGLAPLFVCAGCSFQTPKSDADYGQPPMKYEAAVREYFKFRLEDAESARYEFGPLWIAYGNNGVVYGGTIGWTGHLLDISVDAKNSWGAYTGYEPYMVLFNGEAISDVIEGSEAATLHRVHRVTSRSVAAK